jgi:hypothetical protein
MSCEIFLLLSRFFVKLFRQVEIRSGKAKMGRQWALLFGGGLPKFQPRGIWQTRSMWDSIKIQNYWNHYVVCQLHNQITLLGAIKRDNSFAMPHLTDFFYFLFSYRMGLVVYDYNKLLILSYTVQSVSWIWAS